MVHARKTQGFIHRLCLGSLIVSQLKEGLETQHSPSREEREWGETQRDIKSQGGNQTPRSKIATPADIPWQKVSACSKEIRPRNGSWKQGWALTSLTQLLWKPEERGLGGTGLPAQALGPMAPAKPSRMFPMFFGFLSLCLWWIRANRNEPKIPISWCSVQMLHKVPAV